MPYRPLIKKLLQIKQQSTSNLLKYIFYLLIDTYQCDNSNNNDTSTIAATGSSDENSGGGDLSNTSSINLYLIDLINLIGFNFIKVQSNETQFLLNKILNEINNSNLLSSLFIMRLCTQYVQPNQQTFIQLYTKVLQRLVEYLDDVLCNTTSRQNNSEIFLTIKFDIYLKLLSKFGPEQLKAQMTTKTTTNDTTSDYQSIMTTYYKFVELNIQFLFNIRQPTVQHANENSMNLIEKSLKLIINQCIDNFVSLLDLNYPYNFDYMIKTVLEFSSNRMTVKYNNRHMDLFLNIIKQRELLSISTSTLLDSKTYLSTFVYLSKYFVNEASKYEEK